jgi:hypothetical protein
MHALIVPVAHDFAATVADVERWAARQGFIVTNARPLAADTRVTITTPDGATVRMWGADKSAVFDLWTPRA